MCHYTVHSCLKLCCRLPMGSWLWIDTSTILWATILLHNLHYTMYNIHWLFGITQGSNDVQYKNKHIFCTYEHKFIQQSHWRRSTTARGWNSSSKPLEFTSTQFLRYYSSFWLFATECIPTTHSWVLCYSYPRISFMHLKAQLSG